MIKIDVSLGEAFDKLSILEIKKLNLKNASQQKNILKEISTIQPIIQVFLETTDGITLYRSLLNCNTEIWNLMDEFYLLHNKREIDTNYGRLCYNITELNKSRAYIKREIDERYSSGILEEKSYF
jgi:hypothetical protein